ncbi:MAG: hypothetical protein AB7O73_04505 [Bacteroidia bacterium]
MLLVRKIIALVALVVAFTGGVQAQKSKSDLSCYNKWAMKFEERGAEDIKDGIYTDVIVTSRLGNKAVCYSGKAEVLKGKLVKFYTLLSDGQYDEVKRTWKNKSNDDVSIINGMSNSMITVHNEVINVLWPSALKSKKAKPILAPDPDEE